MSAASPVSLRPPPSGYAEWLVDLKGRIHTAQQRAALAVNRELVGLYWHIGSEILARQAKQGWGARVIDRLAQDLRSAFPDMKGFSPRNLKYMRAFAQAWPEPEFVQQVAAQLPWFHLCTLLDKLKTRAERDWYLVQAVEHNWSRNVLAIQIETRLKDRSGTALTNFDARLPKPQSDLARESLKDPYRLDFLGLGKEAEERDIESALVQHITQFLLELGAGFAYVGRQVHVEVGGDDFFIDLLFYHLKLRCYVVVEIKAGKFKPEHLGQLGFYLTAVDAQIKSEHDGATIGLLLCKTKNKVVAEYALRDSSRPMGIAEYQLIESLPTTLQTSLPSIEQIEQELTDGGEEEQE
ncbi:PDDEXK nuclease domain-containing protein [Massilia sp. CCM 9210]|uniref:PDDEXK nuclease domain-containing protein n=1 Tax=Massilia scottii TaxID=3057166 RepID=UPI0027965B9D|nr:PDDEXK nuclease domain-containing protein [Massilia sp. CCM 9210]MDQ1817432.1 PDDEXK nuclease domain-containing protein [Massilia sp. CCM 9210]